MKASSLAYFALLSLAVPAICLVADPAEPAAPQVRTLSYVVERTLTLEPSGPGGEEEAESAAWTAHLTMNARSLPHGGDGRVVTRFSGGSKLAGPYLRVAETDEEWLEVEHEGEPVYVSRLGLTRPHPANLAAIAEHGNLPPGSEIANRWWGVPIGYEPDDLVDLPPLHCLDPQPAATDYSEGGRLMLRAEAAEALVAMLDEMAASEVPVYVSSAYRSGSTQRRIYLSSTRRRMNQRGVLTNYLGARRAREYETSRMRRFLDDLEPVFPGVKTAYDGSSGAMDWVRMPWARGSYSCPRPGQYTWIYETAGAPELEGRLLFAGEHTSIESAGFMNGAVESGVRAAREALA